MNTLRSKIQLLFFGSLIIFSGNSSFQSSGESPDIKPISKRLVPVAPSVRSHSTEFNCSTNLEDMAHPKKLTSNPMSVNYCLTNKIHFHYETSATKFCHASTYNNLPT